MTKESQGVGRSNDGLAVFVKGAVVGDVVLAELTKVKKNYAFARLIEILEPSEDRIEPFCPYFGQCGGCAYGELSYEAQLDLKEKQVRDKLVRLGGVEDLVKGGEDGSLGLGGKSDAGEAPAMGNDLAGDEALEPGGNLGLDSHLTGDEMPGFDGKPGQGRAFDMPKPRLQPIIGMEEPFRYRNKASMPVWTGGIITRKGGIMENLGEPTIGFYRAKSHEVVDCYDCFLQSEPAMAAADALRRFMKEDNITAYDPKWEKGLMRHLVVKTARGTGEIMVILVINGKGIPNAAKLVDMLDDAIYNLPPTEDGVEYNLESVIINVNKAEGKGGKGKKDQNVSRGQKGGSIFGTECITIAGKPTIMEEVGDLRFEISPLSFYQVNPVQMEVLYDKAMEYASLTGDETVLDLYCGVGTIGLFAAAEMERRQRERAGLAARVCLEGGEPLGDNDEFVENELSVGMTTDGVSGNRTASGANKDGNIERDAAFVENRKITMNAGRVIGIESVKEAVLDANRNAVINGITNARYVCGRAEEELPKLVSGEGLKDESLKIDHANVVFLDPPRAGCDERLLDAVVSVAPERIVYVSCDPATLARDVKYLTENGYRFVEGTPVDMFPWTGSVEVVCLLSKLHSDKHIEVEL